MRRSCWLRKLKNSRLRERLQRAYDDLMALSSCAVPSVRSAARSALSFVAQALNGQGLQYELYTVTWKN